MLLRVKCMCVRARVLLQYEHHLLLQILQRSEQARLDLTEVLLVIDLSRSHRQNVLVVRVVELQRCLGVPLFSLLSLFICRKGEVGGQVILSAIMHATKIKP